MLEEPRFSRVNIWTRGVETGVSPKSIEEGVIESPCAVAELRLTAGAKPSPHPLIITSIKTTPRMEAHWVSRLIDRCAERRRHFDHKTNNGAILRPRSPFFGGCSSLQVIVHNRECGETDNRSRMYFYIGGGVLTGSTDVGIDGW